jgi:hypothetical protein
MRTETCCEVVINNINKAYSCYCWCIVLSESYTSRNRMRPIGINNIGNDVRETGQSGIDCIHVTRVRGQQCGILWIVSDRMVALQEVLSSM